MKKDYIKNFHQDQRRLIIKYLSENTIGFQDISMFNKNEQVVKKEYPNCITFIETD